MFIDRSASRLGIGTIAPGEELQINSLNPAVRLVDETDNQAIDLFYDGNEFVIENGTTGFNIVGIHEDAPANSLEIVSSGNIGLGLSAPERQLHLRGTNAISRMDRSTDTAAFILVRTDAGNNPLKTFVAGVNPSGTDNGEFIINDLGTGVGGAGNRRMTITNAGETHFTGTVVAPGFAPSSSLRFKQKVEPLAEAGAVVRRLQGVRFEWKDTGRPGLGLIAEEVARVLPEVVERDTADGQAAAVNYPSMVAVLVEAVKEQQGELAAYRAEIAAQQARVSALEARLAEIEALLLTGGRLPGVFAHR